MKLNIYRYENKWIKTLIKEAVREVLKEELAELGKQKLMNPYL